MRAYSAGMAGRCAGSPPASASPSRPSASGCATSHGRPAARIGPVAGRLRYPPPAVGQSAAGAVGGFSRSRISAATRRADSTGVVPAFESTSEPEASGTCCRAEPRAGGGSMRHVGSFAASSPPIPAPTVHSPIPTCSSSTMSATRRQTSASWSMPVSYRRVSKRRSQGVKSSASTAIGFEPPAAAAPGEPTQASSTASQRGSAATCSGFATCSVALPVRTAEPASSQCSNSTTSPERQARGPARSRRGWPRSPASRGGPVRGRLRQLPSQAHQGSAQAQPRAPGPSAGPHLRRAALALGLFVSSSCPRSSVGLRAAGF